MKFIIFFADNTNNIDELSIWHTLIYENNTATWP